MLASTTIAGLINSHPFNAIDELGSHKIRRRYAQSRRSNRRSAEAAYSRYGYDGGHRQVYSLQFEHLRLPFSSAHQDATCQHKPHEPVETWRRFGDFVEITAHANVVDDAIPDGRVRP